MLENSKVRGLVNTSHLCISIWGRFEWCQRSRWAIEMTSCFVCSLTVELLLTGLLFLSIHRQSQGVKLQSHRPLLGWHIPLCNHCHCLHHENYGPVFRWCLQVTAALWMFRYSMDCQIKPRPRSKFVCFQSSWWSNIFICDHGPQNQS